MSVCELCGRLKQGRDRVGPYCEPCIAEAIERVFVHAADQPAGNIPEVPDDDGSSSPDSSQSDAETVTSCTLSRGTASHARTRGALIQSQNRPASQRYTRLNFRPAQQMQMLSDFLNTHFPTAEARAGLANRRSYLAALPDMDLTTTPLLRIAIDTLCFAHIGSKTGDLRLVRESQTSYGKVLHSLIKATSAPSGRIPYMEPKAVITSIMLLCLYDDSIPMPHRGTGGWATHYWGAQELLRAYGATFLNMAEPFDRLIFWNLRMPTFFAGVARRRAIILGEPEWLALAEANVESIGPLTEFYRVVMRIPALLERTDNTMLEDVPSAEIESICKDTCKIRQDVKAWYEEKTQRTHGTYLEVPVTFNVEDEPDAFDLEVEEHCYMTTSDTFTAFFKFRTPGYFVKNHTYGIMMGLLLDCTLLRLLHFQPSAARFLQGLSPEGIQRSAYNNAMGLCRSIHHYSNFFSLPYVDFTDFLVDMAQNFFEEVGASKELGWCQAIRCATDLRRTRIKKTVQSRTLCRMGDAGPGFAAATRFRTRNIAQG